MVDLLWFDLILVFVLFGFVNLFVLVTGRFCDYSILVVCFFCYLFNGTALCDFVVLWWFGLFGVSCKLCRLGFVVTWIGCLFDAVCLILLGC